MHARHRSPGNGYRSSSLGMMGGVAATSRISPEGSVRSNVMYGSEYRNHNRGLGRGQTKPFPPPQPPPRRGDIFMEAGRLATEYLVSKGFLPPNVLSSKWQNGSLKNQVGDFQGFRPQEGDNLHFPAEGRTSALARLGDAVPDSGPGRRRFPDEYNPTGSRNYMRGRRRMGSFKSYGSEGNREIGRSAWSEKARGSLDKEGDDDAFFAYQEEQQGGKDGDSGEQMLQHSELPPKSDAAGNSEADLYKYQVPDNMGSKASSSITGRDLSSGPDMEYTESSDGMKILNAGWEVKNDSSSDETEKKSATQDIPIHHCAREDDPASKNGNDLLRLCRFAKVPTKTRSSLTIRGSKIDPVLTTRDEIIHEPGAALPRKPGASIEDVSVQVSLDDAPSNQSQSFKCLESEISKAPPEEGAGELGLSYTAGHGKCTRSISFPDRPFMNKQESNEGPPGFGRCNSLIMERGEKRAAQHNESREGTKKPREWTPSIDTQADDYLHLSSSRGKQQILQKGRTSPGEDVILVADQDSSVDIRLFPKVVSEPQIEYAEEKQLFPGSFKICDLNLMEASDVNENHDADPILIFPSIQQIKKEAVPVDVDLSMSSNCNISDKYGRCGADGKEVEVIDLESDSVQEDKAFNNSERKDETLFTGLESFPNNAQNVNDIPDDHDGYGLMISDFLETDIPNCSSVPPDVNSMHNEMGMHNGEGILGDDDSIYMSLGEIPISFLQGWEQQPTQDYGKPF